MMASLDHFLPAAPAIGVVVVLVSLMLHAAKTRRGHHTSLLLEDLLQVRQDLGLELLDFDVLERGQTSARLVDGHRELLFKYLLGRRGRVCHSCGCACKKQS